MTSQHPLLLLVDDDQSVLDVVARLARRAGFDVVTCAKGQQALEEHVLGGRWPTSLAMVDLRTPDVNGVDVLRAIREAVPGCAMILAAGDAGIDSAVEAITLGAIDHLARPFDFDRLSAVRETVPEEAEGEAARGLEFCDMIGRSAVMQELFGLVRRLAPHVRTALVTGETGTGKELAARALHRMGPRRDKRFVAINCSAVVETLFESELFGHERGAFTGATETKPGLFELADGGTLFLDEMGELPLTVQAKLLRVLETGEVQRVGSLETRRVNAHVFASTNRDLRAEVAASRFRSDLLYRLNVVELRLPPLRCRPEDIPDLTAAFVRECAARLDKPLVGLTAPAERLLASAAWDGNVRELRNVVERACILAEGDLITEKDLSVVLPGVVEPAPTLASPPFPEALAQAQAERTRAQDEQESLATIERDHIMRTLRRAGGNKKAAAKMLGVSRRALYRRLERHQLDQTIARRRAGECRAGD